MEPLTVDETLAQLERIEHTRDLSRWLRGQFAQAHAEQRDAMTRGDADAAHRASARQAALSEWLVAIDSQLSNTD